MLAFLLRNKNKKSKISKQDSTNREKFRTTICHLQGLVVVSYATALVRPLVMHVVLYTGSTSQTMCSKIFMHKKNC